MVRNTPIVSFKVSRPLKLFTLSTYYEHHVVHYTKIGTPFVAVIDCTHVGSVTDSLEDCHSELTDRSVFGIHGIACELLIRSSKNLSA